MNRVLPRPVHLSIQAPPPATASLMEIFEHAYRELRPRAPAPAFDIRFFRFANLNNTIRLREGTARVRLSDLLEGAPPSVLEAIAHILLAKLYRKPIAPARAVRYRRYISSRPMSARDRKSTRLNSSHIQKSRMPSSA